ncbi:MAG: DEAD/DEAH box helicase family protein [Armatimonadetes bacterium]|nr:DEAD/DEAH box helicase family protein [Armatimonadota bacterium]
MLEIEFRPHPDNLALLLQVEQGREDPFERLLLHLQAERISLLEGFEELLCLPALHGVDRFPHQERTALRVMRRLRGRAILGDEVGLGKTVEAGLVLKEYLLRGLVKRALVLCPPSLVEQWQGELAAKFSLPFASTLEPRVRECGTEAWQRFDFLVASMPLARMRRHREALGQCAFDLVVVDEAHHLRNRTSAAWRLVHELPKKFLLLLTATPVQNDLEELYNLITLLRPGQLGTPREFRSRFVDPAEPRKPRNVAALQELMSDVMIRNTRSSVQLVLPPRRARTVRLTPTPEEGELMAEVRNLVREHWGQGRFSGMALTTLLLEAGSSPAALAPTLSRMDFSDLARRAADLSLGSKGQALRELALAHREPVLVFSRFRESLQALAVALRNVGRPVFCYHGGLTPARREEELAAFAAQGGVMLLSEVGGEGKNLQFCRHLINFDLPWNPMKIEQRVGRIHRIGQTEPVQIVNLCLQDSIEDHLLRILDEKLNMFELVVGELDMILGPLEDEGDFEDVLAELSARSADDRELERQLEELGNQLLGLRDEYQEQQAYDQSLFGREFEVED